MALIDEVKKEIVQRNTAVSVPKDEVVPQKRRQRKSPEDMTPEEREKYRMKKIQEEEARCLGAQKARAAVQDKAKKPKPVKENIQKPSPKGNGVAMPKMLQPLQPLYIFKVPGLPKGDALVVCLAHGVE